MTLAVVVTVVLFGVCWLIRAPYRSLPLHIDTGFYVSNDTIATGRLRFKNGWNARYAACSKVVPEFLFSLAYLVGRDRAPERYKTRMRFVATLACFAAAVTVGWVGMVFTGGDVRVYAIGLLLFVLLSSEPQWGAYFESGELFELLPLTASLGLSAVGIQLGDPTTIATAAFIWAVDAFFIKLSSAVGFIVFFAGVAILSPWTAGPIIAGGAAATVLFLVWIARNGKNPWAMLRSLRGHETSFNPRVGVAMIHHRFMEKLRLFARTVRVQPIIPVLGVIGLAFAPPAFPLFWLFSAAVVATYVFQATDCRYYLLPLLVPLSVLACMGVVVLAENESSSVVLVLAATVWIANNPLRAKRLDRHAVHEWVWQGAMSPEFVSRNAALERCAGDLQRAVGQRSLLVYGPLTQAYALAGTSYATPIITPDHHLDDMDETWQADLNARLNDNPPRYLLDTGLCFDVTAARSGLGLDYKLVRSFDSVFHLYELIDRKPVHGDAQTIRTYRPMSLVEIHDEQSRLAAADFHEPSQAIHDPAATALADLLARLADNGIKRVAIYGAGRFTARHADVMRMSGLKVVAVLDDRCINDHGRFLDWPLRRADCWNPADADAVILSSDRFSRMLANRASKLWADRLPVYSVGEDKGSGVVFRDTVANACAS